MREIIQIQVGEQGNHIGEKFWEVISKEHGLKTDGKYDVTADISTCPRISYEQQLDRIVTYYSEGKDFRYIPRAILTDLDPGTIDGVRSGPVGSMFKQQNMVFGQSGAGNNWAKGYCTEGAEMIDQLLDAIRKEVEECESLQGFQMTHSLGQGTGAGFGSLIQNKLYNEYPDLISTTFSTFEVSETIVEPYNIALTLHELTENTDITYLFDTDALYHIFFKILKMTPTAKDKDYLLSSAMSGITTSFRFPSTVNETMRKLAMNMIQFPRLSFLTTGITPLSTRPPDPDEDPVTIHDMTQQMFAPENTLSSCNPKQGTYLTATAVYRGKMSLREVDEAIDELRCSNNRHFVEWLPDNVKTLICPVPPVLVDMAGVSLSNTTAIQEVFRKISEQFAAMYKRKAFLHWYTSEGMDLGEFDEAQNNLLSVIDGYQGLEDAYLAGSAEPIDDEEMAETDIFANDLTPKLQTENELRRNYCSECNEITSPKSPESAINELTPQTNSEGSSITP